MEYDRLHAVIHGVLAGAGSNPGTSCLFFALAGAYLLGKVHERDAGVQVGTAFYCVGGDPPNVLTCARLKDGLYVPNRGAGRFHAWVQCGDWTIDLMAPVFHENAAHQGLRWAVPRRRFQKHADLIVPTLDDIGDPGSFGVVPDHALQAELLEPMTDSPAVLHLISQSESWYRRPPAVQPARITLPHCRGGPQVLQFPNCVIEGDW